MRPKLSISPTFRLEIRRETNTTSSGIGEVKSAEPSKSEPAKSKCTIKMKTVRTAKKGLNEIAGSRSDTVTSDLCTIKSEPSISKAQLLNAAIEIISDEFRKVKSKCSLKTSRASTKYKSKIQRSKSSSTSTGSNHHKIKNHIITGTAFNYIKYKKLKEIAHTAISKQKIFSIYGGFSSIRRALLKRGWVEKLMNGQLKHLQEMSQHSLLARASDGNDHEVTALSKLLRTSAVNFIWQPKYWKFQQETARNVKPFRNRLCRNRTSDFTIKEGLCQCTKERHWFHVTDRCELNCPRSYRLFLPDEIAEFMDDYRFTGCTSLIYFIASKYAEAVKGSDLSELFDEEGTVRTSCIAFALKRISVAINQKEHQDIELCYVDEALNGSHWREFFKDYHALIRMGGKFKSVSPEDHTRFCEECKAKLTIARAYFPNIICDGFFNIWIMKPSGKSRGIGVTLMKDNLQAVEFAMKNKRQRYIVQKYLERPLLIYKTKFDIRQYFLMVTRLTCVQMWMYRKCYLKFSSQEFCLRNCHESVHLTNHFVQKKYGNAAGRSEHLPACNMWTLQNFTDYLDTTLDEQNAWQEKIYPSMRRNVIAAMMGSFDDLILEQNCFELYGGDFMITDQLDSLLLEVNSSPDMTPSTPVTKQICPECLDDVIKVVLDWGDNPYADTGEFELIHEIQIPRVENHEQFAVEGVRYRLRSPPSTPTKCSTPTVPMMRSKYPRSIISPPPSPPKLKPTTTSKPSKPMALLLSDNSKSQTIDIAKNKQQTNMTVRNVGAVKQNSVVNKISNYHKVEQGQFEQVVHPPNSDKIILEGLVKRLNSLQPLKFKTGQQRKGTHMNKLMELNSTIERLLHSRNGSRLRSSDCMKNGRK